MKIKLLTTTRIKLCTAEKYTETKLTIVIFFRDLVIRNDKKKKYLIHVPDTVNYTKLVQLLFLPIPSTKVVMFLDVFVCLSVSYLSVSRNFTK